MIGNDFLITYTQMALEYVEIYL